MINNNKVQVIIGPVLVRVDNLDFMAQEFIGSHMMYDLDDPLFFIVEEVFYTYTGLLARLLRVLKDQHFEYDLVSTEQVQVDSDLNFYHDTSLIEPNFELEGIELYGWQKDVVRALIQTPHGILEAGPGSGKTEMSIAYLKSMNVPTVLLFTRKNYLTQFRNRMIKRGFAKNSLTVLTPKTKKIGQYLFAMVGTFVSACRKAEGAIVDHVNKTEQVLFDEVHRGTSPTALLCYNFLYQAKYWIGLSASPFYTFENEEDTYKDLLLKGVFRKPIVTIPSSWLRDKGFLNKMEVFMLKIKGRPPEHEDIPYYYENSNWPQLVRLYYVDNLPFIAYVASLVYKAFTEGRKVLVIVRQLEMGVKIIESVYSQFSEKINMVSGNNILHSWEGEELVPREEDLIEYLAQNYSYSEEPYMLVGTPFFQEAIDVPSLDYLIDAMGGKNLIKTKQLPGRSGRLFKDKPNSIILDFWFPSSVVLNNQAKKRIKQYEAQGIKVTIIE